MLKKSSTKDQGFLQYFENVILKSPKKIALDAKDGKIEYQELYNRAITVAYHLQVSGAKEGDIVGIFLPKSLDSYISMIGIWLAGCAFLHLDYLSPQNRLNDVVEDAKLNWIIGSNSSHFFPEGVQIVRIDKMNFSQQCTISKLDFSPKRLAYVIYTSGSTGKPKGVMVSHSGVTNILLQQIENFQTTSSSRVLQYLPLNFDASLSCTGTALLSGATLYVEDSSVLKSGKELCQILKKKQITCIVGVSTILSILPFDEIPNCVKTIVIGGEICPPSIMKKFAQRFHLINAYGPTEATICSSMKICSSHCGRPFIGKPIQNAEFLIVDEDMQPLPKGSSGELLIGGIGLALGYLNRKMLTERKFIYYKDKRFYRTGDLVVEHDKSFEFLGRLDRQVKIRGRLIEPEEIEIKISEHPSVNDVVVVPNKEERVAGESPVLIAFMCCKKLLSTEEIRRYLSQYLPNWMLPDQYVFVKTIPRLNNQKVDLRKLVELYKKEDLLQDKIVPPENDLERQLISLWREAFHKENIGTTDNFFDLGGNSLLILKITSLAERSGLTISPSALAYHPTIRQLSYFLTKNVPIELSRTNYMTVEALKQDGQLGEEILDLIKEAKESANKNQSTAVNVLITGSTGFLASKLIIELAKKTSYHFYCLVRGSNKEAARKRLYQAISKHCNVSNAIMERITVVLGDLAACNLGFSQGIWDSLASKIDIVYHSGATVNLIATYQELFATNVMGTKEILRFVCSKKNKALHYISTLSIFVSSDYEKNLIYEDESLEKSKCLYGGYAQTKWGAEYLIDQARLYGLKNVYVYRLGLITGDTKTGFCNRKDFFSRFLHVLLQYKCLPELVGPELKVDITPIDYAALAIVYLSLYGGESHIYNIANSEPLALSKIVEYFEKYGVPIDTMPVNKWSSFINKITNEEDKNSYYLSLCRCFSNAERLKKYKELDLFPLTDFKINTKNTSKVLGSYDIFCPKPDYELVKNYIEFISIQS